MIWHLETYAVKSRCMTIKTFRDLRIWQEAHALSLEIYRITKYFPIDERFGLTDQIRRSATSVGANIAEGKGCGTKKQFIHFLHIAKGSAQETINFCLVARDLNFLESTICRELIHRYDGLIAGIRKCISSMDEK
ncbi:MAG: four helix bundle protein [Patescibacteria group bacterium]